MDLHQSVDRILTEGTTVTDRFYEMLFERHPEAQVLFERTHMSAQSVMLSAALMVSKHSPDYPLGTRQSSRFSVHGMRASRSLASCTRHFGKSFSSRSRISTARIGATTCLASGRRLSRAVRSCSRGMTSVPTSEARVRR